MVGAKTDGRGTMHGGPGRVVASAGAIVPPDRAANAAAERSSACAYVARTLPISLSKPAVPPWTRELTKLLDRRAGARDELVNLRSVERVLRMRGADAGDLPADVLRAAGMELRWLARREVPSRALARLLDQFEHELLQPALRRLLHARDGAVR